MEPLTIRRPEKGEYPALAALWESVFGDGPEFTAPFFAAADPGRYALCSFAGGRLAGMLFLLPGVLGLSGESLEARYLYGAATHPDFRRRGVFRGLEAEAARVASAGGARCVALVPAGPELFSMYQKLGYRTRFWLAETIVPAMTAPRTTLVPCPEGDFLTLRREFLRQRGDYFDLYPALCEFRYRDFIRGGGEIFAAQTPAGDGYTAGRRAGEEYRIEETSLGFPALSHVAGELRRLTGARRVRATGTVGARRPIGMCKPLDESVSFQTLLRANPYLNLMLF